MAEASAIHLRSVAHQARFVLARDALAATQNEDESASQLAASQVAVLQEVLQGEIALARRLHALQSVDSRIGFEASNHYFYVPVDLAEKVVNCRYLLDRWLPTIKR